MGGLPDCNQTNILNCIHELGFRAYLRPRNKWGELYGHSKPLTHDISNFGKLAVHNPIQLKQRMKASTQNWAHDNQTFVCISLTALHCFEKNVPVVSTGNMVVIEHFHLRYIKKCVCL